MPTKNTTMLGLRGLLLLGIMQHIGYYLIWVNLGWQVAAGAYLIIGSKEIFDRYRIA